MARVQLDEDRDVESRYALGRIHSIESMGTVDGPGVRFVVFTQGCPMRCAYSPQPGHVDRGRGGRYVRIGRAPVGRIRENRLFYRTGGLTVTGGEPLLQPEFVAICSRPPMRRLAVVSTHVWTAADRV